MFFWDNLCIFFYKFNEGLRQILEFLTQSCAMHSFFPLIKHSNQVSRDCRGFWKLPDITTGAVEWCIMYVCMYCMHCMHFIYCIYCNQGTRVLKKLTIYFMLCIYVRYELHLLNFFNEVMYCLIYACCNFRFKLCAICLIFTTIYWSYALFCMHHSYT